jgi:hypothetical protein
MNAFQNLKFINHHFMFSFMFFIKSFIQILLIVHFDLLPVTFMPQLSKFRLNKPNPFRSFLHWNIILRVFHRCDICLVDRFGWNVLFIASFSIANRAHMHCSLQAEADESQ